MNGFNGLNGLNHWQPSIQSFNGLPAGLNGGLNGLNFGLVDPMMINCGMTQPIPHSAANFTGKVRVGVAAVKTGSPKFSPY